VLINNDDDDDRKTSASEEFGVGEWDIDTNANLCDGAQMAIFWRVFRSCISSEPRAARLRPAF